MKHTYSGFTYRIIFDEIKEIASRRIRQWLQNIHWQSTVLYYSIAPDDANQVGRLALIQRQAFIWIITDLFVYLRLVTNLSEIWIEIKPFSVCKMHLKMSSPTFVSFSVCHCMNWWKSEMHLFTQVPNAPWGLTHWGRVTHICVGILTIIRSDNGLSPARRQTIIWTNAGILLIGPLGTNFIDSLIETRTFPFSKMYLKMASAKWRPFCLGLNVLKQHTYHVKLIIFLKEQ